MRLVNSQEIVILPNSKNMVKHRADSLYLHRMRVEQAVKSEKSQEKK